MSAGPGLAVKTIGDTEASAEAIRMGFGIGVGPRLFRVRVSTRGVRLSSGVGPFTVSTGSGRRRRSRTARRETPVAASPAQVYRPGDVTVTNLEGASAQQLRTIGSDALTAQLTRAELWLRGGIVLTVACLVLASKSAYFLIPGVALLIVGTIGYLQSRVTLEYELDSQVRGWFDALVAGWPGLGSIKGRWRVQSRTTLHRTHHQKINAGASHLVSRRSVRFSIRPPIVLASDIQTPTVNARGHSLVFLPDRLLVRSGYHWSEVPYQHLQARVSQGRFIESGRSSVPRDGTKVGEQWQYANVRGGHDKRFKNNRLLPVMLYSYIELTSAGGLNWNLQLSRHDCATWWQQVLHDRPATPIDDGEVHSARSA